MLADACTANEVSYSQYIPEPESLYKITFAYPSDWKWEENLHHPDFRSADIHVTDPDSQEIYRGSVTIFVVMSNSAYALGNYPETNARLQMEVEISNFLATKKTIRSEILSDQIIDVDGHYTRQIISRSDPRPPTGEAPAQSEGMVRESIYILDQDRYYVVYFSIPESQRKSDFGESYDALVKSMKFIR
jgi:hypothetical protein